MKRTFSVVLALFGPAALAGLLVTEVTGKAEIVGKGAVTTLAELADGERIAVSANAQIVTVDLTSGHEFVLKGRGNFVVAPGGPKAADGNTLEAKPLPVKSLPHFRVVKIATNSAAQASLVMRGVPETINPLLIFPVRTAVISKTPVFRWKAVDAAVGYRIQVATLDDQMIWDASTRQTELRLPAERELVPGESYQWRVEAVGEARSLSDAAAKFSVAPSDALERLDQLKPGVNAPFGRRVLYAMALREAGAFADANVLWKALSIERPDDEVIRFMAD